MQKKNVATIQIIISIIMIGIMIFNIVYLNLYKSSLKETMMPDQQASNTMRIGLISDFISNQSLILMAIIILLSISLIVNSIYLFKE